MSQGLEIRNEQGSFQVTQETTVLSYLRKGSVSTELAVNNEWVDSSYIAKIPYNPSTEVCALSCANYVSVLYEYQGDLYIGMPYSQETPPLIHYWIFGKNTTTSTSGVQVFDGQGTGVENLLYDSSWIPIKPQTVINVPEIPLGGAAYSTTLPSGKSYAFIPMSVKSETSRSRRELNGSTVDQEWEVSYYRRDHAAKFTGTNFQVKPSDVSMYFYLQFKNWGWTEYSYFTENNVSTNYMIIDVTGL